jgi:flagellar basal-body rod protein FlgB
VDNGKRVRNFRAFTRNLGKIMNQLDSLFNFQQTALRVRGQRQELLAANIANADTPNYKARDISFADTMKNAMGEAGTALASGVTSAAGVAVASAGGPLSLVTGAAGGLATTLLKTSPFHLSATGSGAGSDLTNAKSDALYRTGTQGSVDGNTVDGDVERNQFTDNALHYEASLALLRADIKDMNTALQP